MKKILFLALVASIAFFSCDQKPEKLRYYGIPKDIKGTDTIWPTIPDFSFIDQDSQIITNQTFNDKIYVADFFFTHCPTICPKVKKNMLRIYEKYKTNDRVQLLSHSIDQKHDTIGRLKEYARQLGIDAKKWHLVTGDRDSIYKMPPHYMSIALEEADAPGGYNHSGYIVLIDQKRFIRAYCDGTNADAVTHFMDEMDVLLNELSQPKK